MPLTLWRHMTLELWRLVLLSASVLVTVIAFAAAVKPLADGALTPGGAMKFMLMAIPPMLAYALPFAASFGTTLAYHRMAQDNEITAAQAGGLSHRTLIVPALVSGLLMAGALAALNEQVIPRFLRGMERMVTLDVAQMLVSRIERGQPATLGNMTVYADAIRRVPPEPGSGVLDQLLLLGVAAVETTGDGEVLTDATAERAWVILLPGPMAGFDEGSIAGVIQLERGVGSTEGELRVIDRVRTRPFRVPDAFEDDPKFLTFGELRDLRDRPERMNFVESTRVELARQLAAREGLEKLAQQVQAEGDLRMIGAGGLSIVITSGGIGPDRGWRFAPVTPGGRVIVDLYRPGPNGEPGGGGVDRLEADDAVINLEGHSAGADDALGTTPDERGLTFELILDGVHLSARSSVDGSASTVETEQRRRKIGGLRLRVDPLDRLLELDAAQMVAESASRADPQNAYPGIAEQTLRLERMLAKLQREITSKQHERMAMAASCLVMVLTGAITALLLKNSPPLVVYLWSFFPAVVTIILISTGQRATHSDSPTVGIPLTWSSVAALAAYAGAGLAWVSRR